MTITQVKYVLTVAECGNVSKAAERLFVSQPALSLQIRRLEDELNCELFHRVPQGVTLTAAGNVFCSHARPMLAEWEKFQNGLLEMKMAVCPKVRIGLGSRAISNGLLDEIAAFFEQNPKTDITLITDIGEDMLEMLATKRVDIAIDRLPEKDFLSSKEDFYVVELFRERQCILLAREDKRAGLEEFAFERLNDCPVVCGPENSLNDYIMQSSCRKYGIRPSQVHRGDNPEVIMALVRQGKGAALGPRSFADHYHVAAVPMLPEVEIPLNLICLRQNQKNPLVVRLQEYLRERIRR